MSLHVRFWGVRGSIACPDADWLKYGGNTSCIEVRCDDKLLIFDGGTGLRRLGGSLAAPIRAHLFFTHTHVDHIGGVPFFTPFFDPRNRLDLWAGHLKGQGQTLHEVLSDYMAAPLFPVPPAIFKAQCHYHDFLPREVLTPYPGVEVRTAPLNHPNGAVGYRVTYGQRSLCYVTDTEHRSAEPDQNILELIRGADVLIYDSTYTDAEFPRYVGWGHSTWQEGARLCDLASVKKLVIFHHDPNHDDRFMDRVAAEAEERRPGTVVAREGLTLTL